MIGNFKPNLNKREHWNSRTITSNSCEAFNTDINYKDCYIDVKTINDKKYHHTFEKTYFKITSSSGICKKHYKRR